MFPERFGSLHHARTFIDGFVQFDNHDHNHTGIGLHTPADVHYGLAHTADEHRDRALAAARTAHPERSSTTRTPKILNLPAAAWINPPTPDPTRPATAAPELVAA